jgi:acyl carrier protein
MLIQPCNPETPIEKQQFMEPNTACYKLSAVRGAPSSKHHGWRFIAVLRAGAVHAKSLWQRAKSREKAVNVEQEVRDFIQNKLLFAEEITFTDEDSFLEGGIIDSTGILELVSFLETRYNFKVEEDELQPENLDSVNRLGNFVRNKLALANLRRAK